MKRKWWLLGVISMVMFTLTACQSTNRATNSKKTDKLQIVTTFYPMYDFTKNVAQKDAEITMLIENGVEPHDYEPSAKDIAKIVESDIFVYNSLEMEGWVKKILENIDPKKTEIIDASKGVKLLDMKSEQANDSEKEIHKQEKHEHGMDPHIWLDPVLAQQEVKNIEKGLIKKDKRHQKQYEENADLYLQKLEKLAESYEMTFKNAKNRTFVTQHAAFGYIAKRYNLIQQPIVGLNPEEEPSPARLAELKKFVTNEDIKVIYFESSSSSKTAKTLAEETGVKLEVLNPLEGLSPKKIKAGEDYISVMEKNRQALQKSIY